ncbi:MAG: FAD-dependent oxidoreductase [Thermoleophilia bacterium]|nr:FAD-dependent oxidoreductase [Thermoleophilia bacterium]
MPKPAIVAVDDDAQVLGAVRADLRNKYAADYRIVAADSGGSALEAVEQLHRRGEEVALFLVDQRMPGMTGTEFLLAAAPHFPEAKKVLLTAYADTETAIQSINRVGLDHYLMKPWDPPEDTLYPVLDDLLGDWWAGHRPAFEGIRVVGARWSAATHDVTDFLARNQIPYRLLDAERDAEAAALLDAEQPGALPVVFFPTGTTLVQPDARALAAEVGLQVTASAPFFDLVIVGAGPAGLAAAVYGASEGLRVAVIEQQAIGGQAGSSSRIENYLGFPTGISGSDLARRAAAQAKRFGAEILTAVEVTGIAVDDQSKTVRLDDGSEIRCKAIVIASGMTVRRLDVPGYEQYTGAGVYYGATLAEGATYQGEHVIVVGGANSAGQAAMMLSRFADHVILVVRGMSLEAKMSSYLIDQIAATDKIEVALGTQIAGVRGSETVEQAVLKEAETGAETVRDVSGIFIFAGAVPHTDFLQGVVALDDRGFVLTGPDIDEVGSPPTPWPLDRSPFLQETSVPGIFAAGDACHEVVRRVASAVGQGSICISFVHRYLETV